MKELSFHSSMPAKPKTLFTVGIVAAIIAANVFALTPVMRSWEGRRKKVEYVVSAGSVDHLQAITWDPQKAEVPFTARQATIAARASLKKLVGDSEVHFYCHEILLLTEGGRSGRWYYVVEFWADHESEKWKEEGRTYFAVLPFVVYLDGAVETPWQKMTDQSLKPAR